MHWLGGWLQRKQERISHLCTSFHHLLVFPLVVQSSEGMIVQAISLSPSEVGSLISLGSGESCEICHDISKIESMSSQAVKRFAVQPLTDDSRIFHLSVTDNVQKINDRFSVPVTKAEFAVIRTACSYVLPHMIGWDMIGSHGNRMLTSPPRSAHHSNSRDSLDLSNPDLEWER
ncbi:Single-stranded DNA-binding protein [Nymphaea thermarum]|nr:Single-stranded DNA-binding protein [Nymphaea thermarum]